MLTTGRHVHTQSLRARSSVMPLEMMTGPHFVMIFVQASLMNGVNGRYRSGRRSKIVPVRPLAIRIRSFSGRTFHEVGLKILTAAVPVA